MNLDRLSSFCYKKDVGWGLKCSATLPVPRCKTKQNTLIFTAWCQSTLLTAFVSNCREILTSNGRSQDNFDQILKHWEYVPAKVMHATVGTPWHLVSTDALSVQCIRKNKSEVYHMCRFVRFVVQLPTLQCITTMFLITTNSTTTFQCCCCDHKLCWFIVRAGSV